MRAIYKAEVLRTIACSVEVDVEVELAHHLRATITYVD